MNIKGRILSAKYTLHKVYEYYKYVLPFTKENTNKKNTNKKITIFSEPRGGSTWMADIIGKLPKSILIWEPMYLIPSYKEIKDVHFCFHQYIPENTEWPEAQEYFRQLYNIEIGSFKSLRLYYNNPTLRNLKNAQYFIFKCCNSNMLIPWLTKRFDINPIYILRHPCAVVASQLKYKHWDYILKNVKAYFPDPDCRFKEIYFIYQDIIDKIKRPEERLAAEWALHNSVPSKHPENDIRWVTVAYENIYNNPEYEINRIFSRLNIKVPEILFNDIRKPSITSIEQSHENIKLGNQLGSWKKQLTKDQIKNILSITKEFGMDMYDETEVPDYTKIYS